MTAATLPVIPVADDPFLDAINELHRIQDLVEQVGREEVLAAYPALANEWVMRARRSQLPPPDLLHTWVQLGGRGSGKSLSLAHATHLAVQSGIRSINLIAPTSDTMRDVMVEGPAGLLATAPAGMRPTWLESKSRLTWPNGARALCFSGANPELLRGPNASFSSSTSSQPWNTVRRFSTYRRSA